MVPPLITLEEHYVSSKVRKHLGDKDPYARFPEPMVSKLSSLSSTRISDMDAGSVSLQIISHGPLDATPALCTEANDELAAATTAHSSRLAGFAMLPMGSPDAAATELRRCVRDHKFVGALINNHLNGTFYDDEKFWPVFGAAEELDVPIYIHPTFASDDDQNKYAGNFSNKAAFGMSSAAWGWHSETGSHVLRLWASGLFDKFPKLKIVIGHMGEMLPFQLDRIAVQTKGWGEDVKRDLLTVWRENFWITTSGMFTFPPLECLVDMIGWDRVLYSVDYPFSTNERGLEFVKALEKSGLATKEQLEGFCHGNAEKLLKISVQN
ncbi:hypothetical protein MBLNU457_1293t1 [Dothideomycetes sp. NU457]